MTIVVVLLVMVLLSVLVHLVPGDPARAILGGSATAESVAQVRADMGLDDPLYEQIARFVSGAVRGDLGTDFVSSEPVTSFLWTALPHTIALTVAALLIASLIGIPAGVFSATHPRSPASWPINALSIVLITLPSYLAGLFLLIVFATGLKVLPAVGAGSFSDPVDYLRHLILPAVALGAAWTGYFARLVRASMLEVLSTNYVRAQRAYGLRRRTIHYRYALKNAIIPVVAMLGVGLGSLMAGAIFVELIFARPGLGTMIYDAIQQKNYPVLRGGVLVVAILFVVANLLADLSYRFLDPRIRLRERAA